MGLGFLGDIGKGLVSPITSIISEKVQDVDLRNRLIAAIQSQETKYAYKLQLRQVDLQIEEAKSKSLLVSGGRPAGIWLGIFILAYAGLVYPIASPFVAHFTGVAMLQIDPVVLMGNISALLGLGGYRTYEKRVGVAREGGLGRLPSVLPPPGGD